MDFVSLTDQDTAMHLPLPSTPPITHPVYTVVTSNAPSTTPVLDQSSLIITSQSALADPPPIASPIVRDDERGIILQDNNEDNCHPHSGVFRFNVIAHTQQVHVEKEREMEDAVMTRYANRYIVCFLKQQSVEQVTWI